MKLKFVCRGNKKMIDFLRIFLNVNLIKIIISVPLKWDELNN